MKFKLKDGSVFKMPKPWIKAFEYKLQSEGLDIKKDWKKIEYVFVSGVEKHWNDKTVPNKFGTTTWGNDLKDKFRWEIYDKLAKEENKKKKEYYKKLGIDYNQIDCSCWEDDLQKPRRSFKNYRIINNDIAIADSELRKGRLELIMKWKGKAHKFDDKLMTEHLHKEDEYADKKFKKFKGKIFKNMAELADPVMYQYIRCALMGIVFDEMSRKMNKKEGAVIGMSDKGAVKYTSKKPKKIDLTKLAKK